VVIAYLMLLLVVNRMLPFAGFPVPVAVGGTYPGDARANMMLLWLDCLLMAALVAGFRWWRTRRGAGRLKSPSGLR